MLVEVEYVGINIVKSFKINCEVKKMKPPLTVEAAAAFFFFFPMSVMFVYCQLEKYNYKVKVQVKEGY